MHGLAWRTAQLGLLQGRQAVAVEEAEDVPDLERIKVGGLDGRITMYASLCRLLLGRRPQGGLS
jgi:hypothetical protein